MKTVFVVIACCAFLANCGGGKPEEKPHPPAPEINILPQEVRVEKKPESKILPGYDGFWKDKGEDSYLISVIDFLEYHPDGLPELRNEIYARKGRPFKNKTYQDYFSAKSWYKARPDYTDDWLTVTEKASAEFILSLEKAPNYKDTAAQIMKNLEYHGKYGGISLFFSKTEVIWQETDEYGDYGQNYYDDFPLQWLVLGDWIVIYKDTGKDFYEDVFAILPDHTSQEFVFDDTYPGKSPISRPVLDRLIEAQKDR